MESGDEKTVDQSGTGVRQAGQPTGRIGGSLIGTDRRVPWLLIVALGLVAVAALRWWLLNQAPQAVADLAAAAPSGSHVSVEHVGKPFLDFGGYVPGWEVQVETDDRAAVATAYRLWFSARGFTVVDDTNETTPAGETWLWACNVANLHVQPVSPQVTVAIQESEIDQNGNLSAPQPCY